MVIKASTVTGVEMSVEYKEIKQDEKFPSLALGDPIPWLGVPALVGACAPLGLTFPPNRAHSLLFPQSSWSLSLCGLLPGDIRSALSSSPSKQLILGGLAESHLPEVKPSVTSLSLS